MEYVRFTRIHTMALTLGFFGVGYGLAGRQILSAEFLPWILMALLSHVFVFTHNNYVDYAHDLKDPSKAHMPLVKGKVSLRDAKVIVVASLAGTMFLGAYLSNDKPLSLMFLTLSIFLTYLYNITCKRWIWSWVFLSLSYSTANAFSYFAYAQTVDAILLLVLIYWWLLGFYQIAFEGCWKDIASDKVSFLKRMGSTFSDGVYTPSRLSRATGWIVVLGKLCSALAIVYLLGDTGLYIELTIIFIFSMCYFSGKMLVIQDFNKLKRGKITGSCAAVEVLSYFLLVASLGGRIGLGGALFLILFPMAWFILFNKIMWRTWIAPMV